MIKIIPMKEEHIDKVFDIEQNSFNTPWSKDSFKKEINENSLAHYIVAENNNNIVGYGGMWVIVDEGHITNIAVHPDFRHKGIGKTIVSSLVKEAVNRKLTGLTLEVRKSNVEALNLYRKFGFAGEGIRIKYYHDTGEDAIIMWKYIKNNY